jgi:hypothetical protein
MPHTVSGFILPMTVYTKASHFLLDLVNLGFDMDDSLLLRIWCLWMQKSTENKEDGYLLTYSMVQDII